MFSKLYSVLLSCYREEYHTNIYSLDFFQIKVIFSTLYSTELWSCSVQFSLSSCLTLWTTMDGNTPGFPVLHHLPELAQTHAYWVHDAIQLSHPILLLHSIFPRIRVFSIESVLCIRWPNYWSFSFSISPSNEYSELISFRMDWFGLLPVQGPLKNLSNTTVQKHQFFSTQLSL